MNKWLGILLMHNKHPATNMSQAQCNAQPRKLLLLTIGGMTRQNATSHWTPRVPVLVSEMVESSREERENFASTFTLLHTHSSSSYAFIYSHVYLLISFVVELLHDQCFGSLKSWRSWYYGFFGGLTAGAKRSFQSTQKSWHGLYVLAIGWV